jgi:GNAT superfamily N-acetyltransferase
VIVDIDTISSSTDYEAFSALISEYFEWCRQRHVDHPWLVEMVFSQQVLERELTVLAADYSAPHGKAFLARCDGEIAGGVAYRSFATGICEMKRLFVKERFRRNGVGKRLCQAVIAQARTQGSELMRLETSVLLLHAQKLYQTLGFSVCEPYKEYPERLRPFVSIMEIRCT